MGDLISRKALVESLKGVEIEQWLNDDGTLSDDYYHTTVVEHIEEQPPAQQWIPCSERLPEKRKTVLIQTDCCNWMAVGFMNENSEWFAEDGDGYCTDIVANPIAWMPLPEPYKGE